MENTVSFFSIVRYVAVILFALFVVQMFYSSSAFGWKEREKTILKDSFFWRVTLYDKKLDSGGYEQYYRLYDVRNGGNQMVKIGSPLLEKETSEFNAVQHPQTGDWFSPDAIVYVNERFTNERGYGDSRMRAFWVKNANDIRPFP